MAQDNLSSSVTQRRQKAGHPATHCKLKIYLLEGQEGWWVDVEEGIGGTNGDGNIN